MSTCPMPDRKAEQYELFSGPCDGYRGTSHGAAVLKIAAPGGEAHYTRTDKERDGRRVYVFKELHTADGVQAVKEPAPERVKLTDTSKSSVEVRSGPECLDPVLEPFALWSNREYTEFTLSPGSDPVRGDTPGLRIIETFWAYNMEEASRARDAWFAGYATGYAFRVPEPERSGIVGVIVAAIMALACGAVGALTLAGILWALK